MQPEAIGPVRRPGLIDRIRAPWRGPLARLGMAWVAVLVLFAADWRDMALQWWDSSTYNHVLLVPPIIAWLVSLRTRELVRLTPSGWWPALLPFAGACFLWLLGDFAGLSLARQLAVVVMAQTAMLTLLGPRVGVGVAFPLGYMLFLVPAGDELIPALQTITAHITMGLLHASAVPAQMEGVFITTPAGYFEVAEACSGVKFLIAMIAYGTLVANVCFRSWARRVPFMAMCVIVPILANGIRAWGTIFLAGKLGIGFAAGFDHIFYGWVFFGVVMALVMALGWRFFDRAIDDPMIDADAIAASPVLGRISSWRMGEGWALGAMAALALSVIAWGSAADRLRAPIPAFIELPQVPGWHRIDYRPHAPWQPLHTGADHRLLGRYADGAGHVVDVSYALYASQGEGREAGGFGQGTVPLGSKWAWEASGPAFADFTSDRIQAPGPVRRLAVTTYRTGALTTDSNARLRLEAMADRLLLRRRPTEVLIVSSEDGTSAPPEQSVRAFLSAAGPVGGWMDRVAKLR
jgi:exosortase A